MITHTQSGRRGCTAYIIEAFMGTKGQAYQISLKWSLPCGSRVRVPYRGREPTQFPYPTGWPQRQSPRLSCQLAQGWDRGEEEKMQTPKVVSSQTSKTRVGLLTKQTPFWLNYVSCFTYYTLELDLLMLFFKFEIYMHSWEWSITSSFGASPSGLGVRLCVLKKHTSKDLLYYFKLLPWLLKVAIQILTQLSIWGCKWTCIYGDQEIIGRW